MCHNSIVSAHDVAVLSLKIAWLSALTLTVYTQDSPALTAAFESIDACTTSYMKCYDH